MNAPEGHGPLIAKPIIGKPVIGKPTIGKPTIGKPMIEKPIIGKPVIGKPEIKKPAIEKPSIPPVPDLPTTDEMTTISNQSNVYNNEIIPPPLLLHENESNSVYGKPQIMLPKPNSFVQKPPIQKPKKPVIKVEQTDTYQGKTEEKSTGGRKRLQNGEIKNVEAFVQSLNPKPQQEEEISRIYSFINSLSKEEYQRYRITVETNVMSTENLRDVIQKFLPRDAPVSQHYLALLKGLINMHTAEILDVAQDLAEEEGHMGPLAPHHIQNAFQLLEAKRNRKRNTF